jgi:hypothetical protein
MSCLCRRLTRTSLAGRLFRTNRDAPEAVENQIKWGREQMDMEVPEATVEGEAIADREDLIEKYIVSEMQKFDREIDRATAEREVRAAPASEMPEMRCRPPACSEAGAQDEHRARVAPRAGGRVALEAGD